MAIGLPAASETPGNFRDRAGAGLGEGRGFSGIKCHTTHLPKFAFPPAELSCHLEVDCTKTMCTQQSGSTRVNIIVQEIEGECH